MTAGRSHCWAARCHAGEAPAGATFTVVRRSRTWSRSRPAASGRWSGPTASKRGRRWAGKRLGTPRVGRHFEAVALVDEAAEVAGQRAFAGAQVADDLRHLGREGLQLAAERLGQRGEQFTDLLGPQAGHGPGELSGRDRAGDLGGQPERDAIPLLARRVGVAERHRLAAHGDRFREGVGIEAEVASAGQFGFGDAEEFGVGLVAQQAVKLVDRGDVLEALRVEIEPAPGRDHRGRGGARESASSQPSAGRRGCVRGNGRVVAAASSSVRSA